ncbi:MAG: DUF4384 domain-containing protein, partial [Gammaproteobacteria bacterium]
KMTAILTGQQCKFMIKSTPLYGLVFFLLSCSASHMDINSSELQNIPVELTTHLGYQQQFVEGDEIQFLLSLGSYAYIYMYYINAEDDLVQILPNQNQRSNYYSAGYFLTIPEYDNGYRFIINKPFGDEFIWIFASDQSITLNKNDNSIARIKEKIKQESKQAYGEYVLKITTLKK